MHSDIAVQKCNWFWTFFFFHYFRMTILKLDVTDAKEIEAASTFIKGRLGDEGMLFDPF